MAISEFKATCLAVLERVRRTGQPLLVTRRGEPVAQVVPPPVDVGPESVFGCMAGTIELLGDIVGPALDPSDWEVLHDPDAVLDPEVRRSLDSES